MFRKRKDIKYDAKKYEGIFEEHINNNDEYNLYHKLYTKIYNSYKKKVNRNQINIKTEKVRIEALLGNYNGSLFSFNTAFIVAIMGSMLTLMLEQIVSGLKNYGWALKTVILFVFMIYAIFLIGKEIKRNKPKDLVLFISLKVLEHIENDSLEMSINEITLQNKANDEIAIASLDKIKKTNNTLYVIKHVLKVISKLKSLVSNR